MVTMFILKEEKTGQVAKIFIQAGKLLLMKIEVPAALNAL